MHARALVVVAGLIGGVACGSSTLPTSPSDAGAPAAAPALAPLTPAALAGVWTLSTVDGVPLPVVISQFGDAKIELLSDTLTLAANGTSTERAQSRFTAGSRVETDTTTEDGSFTIEGNTIRFVGKNGTQRTATLSGTTLTASVERMIWGFRKS